MITKTILKFAFRFKQEGSLDFIFPINEIICIKPSYNEDIVQMAEGLHRCRFDAC